MHYELIFDFEQTAFVWSIPLLIGGALVCIALLLFLCRDQIPDTTDFTPKFLGVSVVAAIAICAFAQRQFLWVADEVRAGRVAVVEGAVTSFNPKYLRNLQDYNRERFCVGRHCFDYSENHIGPGFRQTARRGGPIRLGLPVRVTYVGEHIVKLEIKRPGCAAHPYSAACRDPVPPLHSTVDRRE